MINSKYSFLGITVVALLLIFGSTSCSHYEHFAYFEDVPDTSKPVLAKTVPFKTPVIQSGDLLNITIQTLDNDITSLLNTNNQVGGNNNSTVPLLGNSVSGATQTPSGYLVSNEGNVELPFVGSVHLQGLTTSEAKELIIKEVDKYFNNAIVNVRFANFKVTVLGEVLRPSSYIVPSEKINIFDALGMAGDITAYGRRDNVVLLRDTLDEKKIIRFNLNSKDIVSSPWFYLQPNDVVYVSPNKYKLLSIDAVRNKNITIAAAAISLLTIILVRVVPK